MTKQSELHRVLMRHGIDPNSVVGRASCGPGWAPIVDRLITDLIALGWDKHVDQIKEKFGLLRFYSWRVNPPAIFDAVVARIRQAEQESGVTCEECGAPAPGPRGQRWLKTLCDEHHAARQKR